MSEPPFGGTEGYPSPGNYPPPQGNYPPPQGNYPFQPGGYPPPGYFPYQDPAAPYGRDPVTGQPVSDKSKVAAGLLQLLGLFGLLGIGRLYIGQTGFGLAQLLGCLIVVVVTCGWGWAIPAIWAIVDAILIFSGQTRDSGGRQLRG